MKLSDKICRIYGYGIFEIFLGQIMAQDYKEIQFFSPWMGPFPTWHNQYIGKGIPGITRLDSWEDGQENVDLFCFFDVGDGDKQKQLRERIKKGELKKDARVFGAGESGEQEMDRLKFKKTLVAQGLAVPKYDIVVGIDALHTLLKKEKDLWIKLNVENRGLMETFHHKTYKKSLGKLDELAHKLGPLRETEKFMWEKPIPGVEPGADWFMAHSEYYEQGLWGYEAKGDGYCAKVSTYDDLPAPIKKVNNAMKPVWKRYDICGALSSEIRFGLSRIPHFIDACQRMGNPPAASISSIYKNLPKIIDAVAGGEIIKPEFNGTHVAELTIEAEGAKEEPIPFDWSEKDMHSIKLRRACVVDGQYWNIPFKDSATVAKAVGVGDSREEAEFNALEAAAKFECEGKTYNKATFEELEEITKEAKKYGLPDL